MANPRDRKPLVKQDTLSSVEDLPSECEDEAQVQPTTPHTQSSDLSEPKAEPTKTQKEGTKLNIVSTLDSSESESESTDSHKKKRKNVTFGPAIKFMPLISSSTSDTSEEVIFDRQAIKQSTPSLQEPPKKIRVKSTDTITTIDDEKINQPEGEKPVASTSFVVPELPPLTKAKAFKNILVEAQTYSSRTPIEKKKDDSSSMESSSSTKVSISSEHTKTLSSDAIEDFVREQTDAGTEPKLSAEVEEMSVNEVSCIPSEEESSL